MSAIREQSFLRWVDLVQLVSANKWIKPKGGDGVETFALAFRLLDRRGWSLREKSTADPGLDLVYLLGDLARQVQDSILGDYDVVFDPDADAFESLGGVRIVR